MNMQPRVDFDYDAFEEEVFRASLKAFTNLQNDFSHEKFYGFALGTSPSFLWVTPHANTEEGLARTARKYANYDYMAGVSFDDMKAYLRPNIGAYDIPMESYDLSFNKANEMISFHSEQVDELEDRYIDELGEDREDEVFFDIIYPLYERIEARIVNAIRRLDQRHIFEKTNSRDNITLLFSSDLGDPEVYTVEELNPPHVCEKFIKDCQKSREVYEATLGDRNTSRNRKSPPIQRKNKSQENLNGRKSSAPKP